MNSALLMMTVWLAGAEPAPMPPAVAPAHGACCAPACDCCKPTFRDRFNAFKNVCGTYSTDCCGCCHYNRPTLKDRCCAWKSACGTCKPCCDPCCKH